jgi:hypothetical protein
MQKAGGNAEGRWKCRRQKDECRSRRESPQQQSIWFPAFGFFILHSAFCILPFFLRFHPYNPCSPTSPGGPALSDRYFQHTFANGLTLLAENMPGMQSAAFSFVLPAGSVTDP